MAGGQAAPRPVHDEFPTATEPDGGTTDGEMSDDEFGHQIILGAVIGIVATFVVMTVGVLATTGISAAVPAMAWASIVGGGFFGGTVTVGLAMGRAEEAARAARLRPEVGQASGRAA